MSEFRRSQQVKGSKRRSVTLNSTVVSQHKDGANVGNHDHHVLTAVGYSSSGRVDSSEERRRSGKKRWNPHINVTRDRE